MLNIILEPELEQRLHAIAAKSGHSTAQLAREAIIELIENHEDLAAAQAMPLTADQKAELNRRRAELESGAVRGLPWEEVRQSLLSRR